MERNTPNIGYYQQPVDSSVLALHSPLPSPSAPAPLSYSLTHSPSSPSPQAAAQTDYSDSISCFSTPAQYPPQGRISYSLHFLSRYLKFNLRGDQLQLITPSRNPIAELLYPQGDLLMLAFELILEVAKYQKSHLYSIKCLQFRDHFSYS